MRVLNLVPGEKVLIQRVHKPPLDQMLSARLQFRRSARLLFKRSAVCSSAQFQRASVDPVERYRAQLEHKAKEIGAASIDELKAKLEETIKAKRYEFNKVDPLKELEEYEQQAQVAAREKYEQNKLRDPRPIDLPEKPYKTLSSYIAVDKAQDLTPQEIEVIWAARFRHKDDSLTSVVPSSVWDKLARNARENPTFVLPLPREGDGMEMHYVQWAFVGPHTVHCMFTTLLEFKTHGEYARPHTTVVFHTELQEPKGLVLMSGTVEKDSSVGLPEAQLLLLNIQRFYGAMHDTPATQRRLKLLMDFTSGSKDFSVDKLVEEAQSLDS